MTTPNKNLDYTSPYGKSVQQYPSQSENFLSLEVGGPGETSTSMSHSKQGKKQYEKRYFSTPAKTYDNNGGGNSNAYFYQNKQQRGRYQGRNNNYNGYRNSQTQNQQHNRWNNEHRKSGNGYKNFKQFGNRQDQSDSYFHPTMLEDPWADLMERYNAIKTYENKLNALQRTNSNHSNISEPNSTSSQTSQDDNSKHSDRNDTN